MKLWAAVVLGALASSEEFLGRREGTRGAARRRTTTTTTPAPLVGIGGRAERVALREELAAGVREDAAGARDEAVGAVRAAAPEVAARMDELRYAACSGTIADGAAVGMSQLLTGRAASDVQGPLLARMQELAVELELPEGPNVWRSTVAPREGSYRESLAQTRADAVSGLLALTDGVAPRSAHLRQTIVEMGMKLATQVGDREGGLNKFLVVHTDVSPLAGVREDVGAVLQRSRILPVVVAYARSPRVSRESAEYLQDLTGCADLLDCPNLFYTQPTELSVRNTANAVGEFLCTVIESARENALGGAPAGSPEDPPPEPLP